MWGRQRWAASLGLLSSEKVRAELCLPKTPTDTTAIIIIFSLVKDKSRLRKLLCSKTSMQLRLRQDLCWQMGNTSAFFLSCSIFQRTELDIFTALSSEEAAFGDVILC